MGKNPLIILELSRFPTHIEFSKGKNPKFVKVNYQNIYNGRINEFSRALMVRNLHSFIERELPRGEFLGNNLEEEIEVYTVINHDSISRRKQAGEYNILWKPAPLDYIPRWDIENLASIWSKVINDTLIELNYLENDTVHYITSIKYNFIPIEDLNNRKILIKFYRNDR